MHKKEKHVMLSPYFMNQEFMFYLHAHNSTTKAFSVLLNSASRKYPRGSVAKLVDISKICRSVKSWIRGTFF